MWHLYTCSINTCEQTGAVKWNKLAMLRTYTMGKYNLEKCNLKIKIWNLLVLSTDTVEIWKCLLTYVVVDPSGPGAVHRYSTTTTKRTCLNLMMERSSTSWLRRSGAGLTIQQRGSRPILQYSDLSMFSLSLSSICFSSALQYVFTQPLWYVFTQLSNMFSL